MEIPISAPLQDHDWDLERKRWTIYYEHLLRDRLIWSKEYFHQPDLQPAQVADHIGSFMTMLHQAHLQPDFHPLALDLISTLHPWLSRLGYWSALEQQLRFAVQVTSRQSQINRQVEFLGKLADVYFYTGRLDDALLVSRQAVELARNTYDAFSLVTAIGPIISTLRTQGRVKEASDLLDEIESDPVLENANDPAKSKALARLGLHRIMLLRYQGQLNEAIFRANHIIDLLEALTDTDHHILAEAYRGRGQIFRIYGNYNSSAQDLRRAKALFSREGNLTDEAVTNNLLGVAYWSMGQLDLAEEAIRFSIEIAERLNARWHLTRFVGNLGLVYLSRGLLAQALGYFERQFALASDLGDMQEMNRSHGNLGTVKLHLGEFDVARRELEVELDFLKQQGRLEEAGLDYVLLSWCYSGLGQQDRAQSLAGQGLEIANQKQSSVLQVAVMRCLAEYEAPTPSIEHLRLALTLARDRTMQLHEAACLLSLAHLSEDEREQAKLWEQGVSLLEKIGATAWLEGHTVLNPPRICLAV